jgi:hypothetical protein
MLRQQVQHVTCKTALFLGGLGQHAGRLCRGQDDEVDLAAVASSWTCVITGNAPSAPLSGEDEGRRTRRHAPLGARPLLARWRRGRFPPPSKTTELDGGAAVPI